MTRDELAADWTGGIPFALETLVDDKDPDPITFDFSAESLTRLLAEVRLVMRDAADVLDTDDPEHRRGVLAYLGETFALVCGGSWDWDDEPGFAERGLPAVTDPVTLASIASTYFGFDDNPAGTPAGIPVVLSDAALGLAPVSPVHLLLAGVTDRDTDLWRDTYQELAGFVAGYSAAHPEWAPKQTDTPNMGEGPSIPGPSPVLNSWLMKWQNEFPSWAQRHPGEWDFSAESMDRLDELILGRVSDAASFAAAENRDLVEGACWYLGEGLIRRGADNGLPSRWVYRGWLKERGSPDLACFEVQSDDNTRNVTPFWSLSYSVKKRVHSAREDFDFWRGN
ncbi:hypothetical protein MINS_00550 [Mycolicibacterium insubricum]|jgi:hypothetical protein|uniref:Uncharacterized protein n=1 Tax=Mycolicibacterium insubricum TaxID=444597 RepID=A0A1X0DDR7_9MYCO|nr:hypothetical protein [Mycolicibacterium insubricum]MCB9438971.1 hypothetical protein [Mycolicibacterium sp.]MCV7080114.1 hypothetical protein [Mycolicibacterium insubricum]ORA70487.1 hypothetical protein BST26_10690 [Mycolicibacterium insubricum]BBZ64626.1 hypothetical protein MINS_00550 [Mycolicibacterium insubricum]